MTTSTLKTQQQPKYSFIPKSYPRFEFTIPEFKSMSLSAQPVEGVPPEGLIANAQQDAVAKWLTMRREALVEVKNNEGKSFMVARSVLLKSANSRETDYNYAFNYILYLFDKTKTVEEQLQKMPNLRLQAWFDEMGPATGTFSGYGNGRFFDIDPKSWSQVWSYADRILLTP